jgi:hypothetical protein
MSELMLLGCVACIATAGLAAALAPLRSVVASVVVAILLPVLVACIVSALRIAAFCTGNCEPSEGVGELDLWMAGLLVFGSCAAVICAARIVMWLTWKRSMRKFGKAPRNATAMGDSLSRSR